jgi:hypothetical protein
MSCFNWFKSKPRYELITDGCGKYAVRCNFGMHAGKLYIFEINSEYSYSPQTLALDYCWTTKDKAEAVYLRLTA